jgi:phytanoyl-CoA hydroxylase
MPSGPSFLTIATDCLEYFEARAAQESPAQAAFLQGADAARQWLALLQLASPDPFAAEALFAQMNTHRHFRSWSVRWHYLAEAMNTWRDEEGLLSMEPIGTEADGGLKATYEQFGYVVVRQLFPPDEVAALKDEILRVVAEKGHHAGVFVGLAATSPVFAEAMRDPRLLDALEPLLGPDIEFLSDKVVYKSADLDYGSPWHQDWPYWKGAHKLSVWVALEAATKENGCLKLLPGSHKSLAEHDGTAKEGEGFGHRLAEDAVDETLAVSLPCEPGDAVFFHDLTLHASHPNTSGQDRYAWIVTYRNAAEEDLTYDWSVAAAIVRGERRTVAAAVAAEDCASPE